MTASLRNIVHPNCTLSNVFGDSVSFLSSPGFRYEELQGEAAKGQASALSDGTKHNYRSIWSLYDEFTRFHNLKPFPATPEILSSFITLVGFSVKSLKTLYNYISALHKLHDVCSFNSAAFDDIRVKLTLKGLEILKRHIPLRKLPITPDMLLKFRSLLDLGNSAHLTLWAALLFDFFTFFQTANLCPPSRETFSCFSTLSRNDMRGNYSNVHHDKTIRRHSPDRSYPLSSKQEPACVVAVFTFRGQGTGVIDEKKHVGGLSTKDVQEITNNAVLVKTKRP